MGQTIQTSRKEKTQVHTSAEGNFINNLTVVNGKTTASKNLAYFTDMTRLIPFTKPQDIFRHETSFQKRGKTNLSYLHSESVFVPPK